MILKVKQISKLSIIIGIVLLIGTLLLNKSTELFYIKYMSVFSYFISLSLGAAFLILLHTMTRGGWGVIIKRVPEHLMSLLPLFALLFLPILFGVEHIFDWLDAEHIKHDVLIQVKQPYLNLPFFVIRNIFYFLSWAIISIYYCKKSFAQDQMMNESDQENITRDLQRKSPLAILFLSITTSFAAFDWLMSLYPHWFSTIYGVYYFAGGITFCLAVVILIYELLSSLKLTDEYPNVEHFHDLSKLLYGFNIFWAYVAFSQYFLTWYANIPEFTQWYYPRLQGEWLSIFYILVVFHFIIPLFGFMSRHVKRNRIGRIFFSTLIIIVHYIDIRYNIFPNYIKETGISSQEVLLLVSFFFIIFGFLMKQIVSYSIIPQNHPRLKESKHLENAL